MNYKVRIKNFEGPFDLLLKLVTTQKLDVGTISITEIVDQYLAQVSHMQQVDLDIASDFLLVATTLLKIKTDLILKSRIDDDNYEELEPSELKNELVKKLVVYKQFKNAAQSLSDLEDQQNRLFARNCGPDPYFANITPDFLADINEEDFAKIAADCFARRDEFLLNATHIASKPIPVIAYVKTIHSRISNKKKMKFSELIDPQASVKIVVVNFLALLELYKHNYVDIYQSKANEILIDYIEGSGELNINLAELEEV